VRAYASFDRLTIKKVAAQPSASEMLAKKATAKHSFSGV
jgi:hypothetical protein